MTDLPWRIEMLGWLRATRGDQVVRRFRMQKAGALLAYLAYYSHRSQARSELIELLWPDCDPQVGRHNLRQALSSLRHQMEPPGIVPGSIIIADHATVQLNPAAVETDVAQFEAALQAAARAGNAVQQAQILTEAAELYRGELLPGRFETWVLAERQQLEERFLRTLEQLVAHCERMGDFTQALRWARRAVAADPLREEAQHALIRLLAASGKNAAARRQYQMLKRLLQDELGLSPTPEIQDLADTLDERFTRSKHGGGRRDAPPRLLTPPPEDTPCPPALPNGTVTFFLAEIEGGAALREPAEGDTWGAQGKYDELLSSVFRRHGGHELWSPAAECGEMGVSGNPEVEIPQPGRAGWIPRLQVVFGRASDSLAAAVAAQRALAAVPPREGRGAPLVRIALHTGEVASGQALHFSPEIQRATWLLSAAHPGQILLSERTAAMLHGRLLPGLQLIDLGLFRLRDPSPPERLFQATYPDMAPREFSPPRALPARAGHVPPRFTRFFGRQQEIVRLRETLEDAETRLVTLTGPGGSGKTRLACETVDGLRESWQGAAWFVPLVDLMEPRLIADKVLEGLRLPRSPHLEPLEQVIAFLAQQPSLLLLDNLEHLLSAGTAIVQTLIERVATLTVLVTSRERLDLPGEREFPVQPLPTPVDSEQGRRRRQDANSAAEVSTIPLLPVALTECPSVQLFVDRAQMARADFQVTKTNAAEVAELCRRLEGLPLALELAAARIGVLTPRQMLVRLGRRFELLVRRQEGNDARHRSLRAALDWSHQLLTPEIQRFFARLSVFRRGWTLEAAEAIGQEPRALEFLEQLRACSLVLAEETGARTIRGPGFQERQSAMPERSEADRPTPEMRFFLLETMREYGAERLQPEEQADLSRRHARYYLTLAEEAEPKLMTGERGEWLDLLDREHDNLRAVLAWSLAVGGAGGLEPDAGLGGADIETPRQPGALGVSDADGMTEIGSQLAGALTWFWFHRNHLREGRKWLDGLLAHSREAGRPSFDERRDRSDGSPPPARPLHPAGIASKVRARALYAAGLLAWEQGDLPAAHTLLEESAAIGRDLGDKRLIAHPLVWLGIVMSHQDERARALSHHEESVTLFRETDDRWGLALSLGFLGANLDSDQPMRTRLDESIRLFRELGEPWGLAFPLGFLGDLEWRQGNHKRARALFEEALALRRAAGHRFAIAHSLQYLVRVALHEGDLWRAAALLLERLSLFREMGHRLNVAWTLLGLAEVALLAGDYEAARSPIGESLIMCRELGDRSGIAMGAMRLGAVALGQQDFRRAAALFGESWPAFRDLGDVLRLAGCFTGLGAVAAAEGQCEQAARLFGAAAALCETAGVRQSWSEQAIYDRGMAAARAGGGEEAVSAAWIEGRAMTSEQATALATWVASRT
jgi:predicted ATPase/DNA-binding SARP family transcriptional activator